MSAVRVATKEGSKLRVEWLIYISPARTDSTRLLMLSKRACVSFFVTQRAIWSSTYIMK